MPGDFWVIFRKSEDFDLCFLGQKGTQKKPANPYIIRICGVGAANQN
jgi:hypothetical protein